MQPKSFIEFNLAQSRDVLDKTLGDAELVRSIADASILIVDALRQGHKVMLAGNGGSAADAQHIAAELVGRFQVERDALAALALTTDTSILTAVGNDYGFEHLFSRQVRALGREGDVLIAISTSGRSPNIISACQAAADLRMTVIGMTGANGEAMDDICDIVLKVPDSNTAMIQQVHMTIGHILCGLIEREMFAKP